MGKKKVSKPTFMACKNCGGKGYKEEFNEFHGVMARWQCSVCDGAGKLELPDHPLIVIPSDMYKCGFCSQRSAKDTCGLGVRDGKALPDNRACFRIAEFFIGESVGRDNVS